MASFQHGPRLFFKGRIVNQLASITKFSNVASSSRLVRSQPGKQLHMREYRHSAGTHLVPSIVFSRCQSSTSATNATPTQMHADASTPGNKSSNQRTPEGPSYTNSYNPTLVDNLLKNMEGDMPLSEMPDPFVKDYPRCFLCRYGTELDHKNVRLLSQFVSPYTGRIYGRSITGLCIPMQRRISQLIKRARQSGYMPYILKDPKYLHDPQPYDSMARKT